MGGKYNLDLQRHAGHVWPHARSTDRDRPGGRVAGVLGALRARAVRGCLGIDQLPIRLSCDLHGSYGREQFHQWIITFVALPVTTGETREAIELVVDRSENIHGPYK